MEAGKFTYDEHLKLFVNDKEELNYCKNCGDEIDSDETYCDHCKEWLEENKPKISTI